ncbi:unnamed protein product [Orchesella dallaii]|uniref:Acyltransferase n=1 Tax=Orchesella dallaii TaxID=48710 RepID=A0ABP1QM32_9HEXA
MGKHEDDPSSSEGDLLVYTFRSHHNAYQEEDGSGATIIRKEIKPGVLRTIAQYFHGVILIHYFLWFIPMFFMLYLPTYFGYWWVSWIMLTMYLRTYYTVDELKRGRPWNWLRTHRLWKLMQNYLQLEVVREAKLDPKRQYIFGTHPHGIIILSRTSTYGNLFERLFPGIEQRVLGATPMFNLPGSRELCLWMGAVRADKANAVQILEKHKLSLLLYPGGSSEIFETDSESTDTVIIARKGFIRLALQHGCDLVPSFVFGEKHAYHKLNLPEKFKKFMMETLRTPLIIFWGKFFTWLPLQQEKFYLSTIFGKPIRVEKAVAEPSEEEVNELYEQFYSEIRNLYEKYKERYGYGTTERLVIREAHKEEKPNKKAYQNGHANGNGVSKSSTISPEKQPNGISNGNGYTNGFASHAANGIQNGGAKLVKCALND